MQWYASAVAKAVNMETDFDDNMTWTLHTSTYTPSRFVDDYVNDLAGELASGGGYTSGGMSAGAVSRTITVANSWAVQRAASTAYALGDVVRPAAANGFLYRATSAGTTAAGLPTYPTILGQTVADGGVTWECYGSGIMVFLAAVTPSWGPSATLSGIRYLVLSDRTPGASSAQPLIAFTDFVTDQAVTTGTFQVNPHASLGNCHIAIP